MRRKHLTPIYLSLAAAFGVLLGIVISRSNNANTFINKGGNTPSLTFYQNEFDFSHITGELFSLFYSK